MESRISKIEAIIPMLATREDLAIHEGLMREELTKLKGLMREDLTKLEGLMREELAKHATATHAAINQQTLKIIVWVTGVFAMSTATSFFIAARMHA